ncbi:MAG: glycine--tRNA ligase subunit beta, partial [Trichlorobacter sp.]
MAKELLFEIGAEEIPAGFVTAAITSIKEMLTKELAAARLDFTSVETFGTPRRLVALVKGLPACQPDAELTVSGPSRSAAFGADGTPTKACEGFLR